MTNYSLSPPGKTGNRLRHSAEQSCLRFSFPVVVVAVVAAAAVVVELLSIGWPF